MRNGMKGVFVATAVASLFSAALAADAPKADKKTDKEEKIHCSGINSCKGTCSCSSASNACKGMNSCKGKGWIEATAKDCTDKGGTIVKEDKDEKKGKKKA